MFLVDKVPDYYRLFILDERRWFPHQTVARLGMVDSPGYITFPRLGWTHLTAVLPLWTLFCDDTNRGMLLQCLKQDAVDDFLYKVSLLQCEREALHISLDLEVINDTQFEGTQDKSLPNIQKVATRLKSCIQENRAYEDKLRRVASVHPTSSPPRDDFDKLAIRFSELDNSLVQCFYRQTTTLTAAGTDENLKQTKATKKQATAIYEQTRSMSALTWLAFFYVPLTFVTGIFGMSGKEIDPGKPLSCVLYAKIAVGFLGVSVLAAAI